MSQPIHVLGISGSLRKGSYNSGVLRAAQTLAPAEMKISVWDIAAIPLYNEDVYQQGFPPAVEKFREAVRAADALLIVTPEYNYSVPGVLKNAIDYASRPPAHPFSGKPAMIMGASPSVTGTARSQAHLRQVLTCLNVATMPYPDVLIGSALTKFDDQGNLTDEKTKEFLRKNLAGFQNWISHFRNNS